ncbi:DHA2 family efflux MFS transporter permease subunit [Parafrankia sp. EUN1f]|uniref:DHA2 family efflux MFS transporter permease subunit n=1 Tax=Parafrankia sp. EUN1f TaxID=102897 RepID=UPI0001C44300|nr:DHA2 family efflux MFS transporter permease subunit [Parafrankia sp. EUN1f]EFC84568.1 drug resistance transporter, EmrB/QacA subfamily [Parafrankia sp. EUN1f]
MSSTPVDLTGNEAAQGSAAGPPPISEAAAAEDVGPLDRQEVGADDQVVGRHVWLVSGVVVVGAFMTQLDGALVNVGLATVAQDLGASLSTAQWIVSGYLLALVIGLPLCGWASRRIGAGSLWLWVLTGFTVTSALCAAAPDIGSLVAARAAQGFAGGLLLPAGQTIIAQVSGKKLMGRVMSTVGMALVLGPALGPTVGGLLIAHASWRWLFLVNIPVGAVGLWLGRRLIPRGDRAPGSNFDLTGFALIGIALPALTFAVSWSSDHHGRSLPLIAIPLLVGVVALGAFVRRGRRVQTPLLNTRLLAGRVFAAAAASSFLAGVIQFGALVIWALYFQLARGYDVVETGLAMIGFAAGAAVLPVAGRLTDRFGGGPVSLAGGLLTTMAFVPVALLPDGIDMIVIEGCLFVLGVGNALSVVPSSTAAYVAVEPAQLPDAVTMINVFLRLGGAVGAALLVTVLSWAAGTDATAAGSTGSATFHAPFWCLCALSGLFVASASWLVASTGRPARQ